MEEGPGDGGAHAFRVAADRGEPLELDSKDVDQEDSKAEGGDRAGQERERIEAAIEDAALIGGEGAEEVSYQPAKHDGGELQEERPGQGGADDLADPLGVLQDGRPQIAAQAHAQIVEELGDERLLHRAAGGVVLHLSAGVDLHQAELFQISIFLGARRGGVEAAGGPGQHGVDRVRLSHARQEEVDGHGHQEGERVPAGAAEHVLQGWMVLEHRACPQGAVGRSDQSIKVPGPSPGICEGKKGCAAVGKPVQTFSLNS